MRTLFVRSGGGMPGLDIHAGIWLALEEVGITPTAVHGTSAGAIVSAMQASGRKADFAAALLSGLTDRDIRAERCLWKLRIPWINYWLENAPIRALLETTCDKGWSQCELPLACWATRLDTGEPVNVARPDLAATPADAALASMSICGIFEPVQLSDGSSYVDGGVRRNLPLPDDWQSYDDVWLLIASSRPSDYRPSRGILTHLLRNVSWLMVDQITDVLDRVHGAQRPRVHVIWPKVRNHSGTLHFNHGLIQQAYLETLSQLQKEFSP